MSDDKRLSESQKKNQGKILKDNPEAKKGQKEICFRNKGSITK